MYGFYVNPNTLFHSATLKTKDKAPKLATVTVYYSKGSSGIRCYRSTNETVPSQYISWFQEFLGFALPYTDYFLGNQRSWRYFVLPLHNFFPSGQHRASLVAQVVKPVMQETWVQSLGWKIPRRRQWQATPVFLPGESHGWRSLVG